MRKPIKEAFVLTATLLLASVSLPAATYQLDNNTISTALNASEGTEPLDNWFGNVFTVVGGGTSITAVNFGIFTTTANSVADVVLYSVTGAGGNPALGATRVYTQAFTPLTGDGTNAFNQTINLTTPVNFNVGDHLLVAVMIRDVIAASPNDVYPYLLDTSGSAAGSYWDRANPNAFNLDNLSAAVTTGQPFQAGGFIPGPGHVFIRATAIPEPSTIALSFLGGIFAMLFLRRRK
jgi:hypothetical protein